MAARRKEHNLTTAAIEAAGGQGEKRLKASHDGKLMYKWKRELIKTIAQVNFCHISLRYNAKNVAVGYDLIGRESNIVAVKNFFGYLSETIERMVAAEVGGNHRDHLSRYAHSFRLGVADRLKERLKERHEEKLREQERAAREANAANRHPGAATGNALVVVLRDFARQEEDLNHDLRFGYAPGTTAARRAKSEADHAAAMAARKLKIAELRASDPTITEELAQWMAAGWTRERAEEMLRPAKPETEAQRRRREEKDARYWERADRRAWNESCKIDHRAFASGRRAAEEIGLDTQVGRNSAKRLG